MATTITCGVQKGGCGKTTNAGILAKLLHMDGYRVLSVDMDSQGNMTEFLTKLPSKTFKDSSVFEAMITKEPKEFIYQIEENFDILPATNFLALFPRWLYTFDYFRDEITYEGKWVEQLSRTLEPIKNDYDYIIIDTPPSLGEHTTNAFVASDYVVIMYESSMFCYNAIPDFIDTLEITERHSPNKLEILGILRTLNHKTRVDSKHYNDKIAEDFPELVFNTIITRKASIGRLPEFGFKDNPELKDALKEYKLFYKEFKQRIGISEKTEV